MHKKSMNLFHIFVIESHACKSHVTGNMKYVCHDLMDELRLIAFDKNPERR